MVVNFPLLYRVPHFGIVLNNVKEFIRERRAYIRVKSIQEAVKKEYIILCKSKIYYLIFFS